jgi:hypothetical protein
MFPPLEKADAYVHEVAQILANHHQETSQQVHARLQQCLDRMLEQKSQLGPLSDAFDHFVKTTNSFAKGLFHCYDVPDLPATNNDLEQCFGSLRYHERRITGRKATVPTVVVRGSVRIIAILVSFTQVFSAQDLRPNNLKEWQELRKTLGVRSYARQQQRRFRKDPAKYLTDLGARLLQAEQLSP